MAATPRKVHLKWPSRRSLLQSDSSSLGRRFIVSESGIAKRNISHNPMAAKGGGRLSLTIMLTLTVITITLMLTITLLLTMTKTLSLTLTGTLTLNLTSTSTLTPIQTETLTLALALTLNLTPDLNPKMKTDPARTQILGMGCSCVQLFLQTTKDTDTWEGIGNLL